MIQTATDDLDSKKITPRQFLTRVQFKCNLSAFADFNTVANNSDDTLVEDLKLDYGTDEEEEGAVGGSNDEQEQLRKQQPNDQLICCVCLENPVTILFLACGHYCLCEQYFSVLKTGAIERGAISEAPVPNNNDNELLDEVQYLLTCPKCRKNNSSISDVVKRRIFF